MRFTPPKIGFILLAFSLSQYGCRSHSAISLTGRSSFELLESQKTAQIVQADEKNTDIKINYIAGSVSLSSLKKPIYPPAALEAHAGRCVVYATITFDETGHESYVSQSWKRMPDLNRFADAFFNEVKVAASTWTISPPCNVYYIMDKDGNRRHLRTETLSEKYDFRFIFESDGSVK
jgi:hypothetical protein